MSGNLLLPLLLAIAVSPLAPALPQGAAPDAGQGRPQSGGRHGQYAGMARAAGEVTAVAGNTLTIKGEDGAPSQIVTTDNTQFMKERGPVRLSDLHTGDGVMAMGNLDPATHTLHAAVVMAEDAAEVKAMRDNLGKTYITGRVTAVDLDNAKITVERPDRVAQTIGFDETTSFKRAVRSQRTGAADGGESARRSGAGGPGESGGAGSGGGEYRGGMGFMAAGGGMDQAFSRGESITLADIKVGDHVIGTGSVKGGVFVPVHLLESPPGQRRARGGADAGNPGTPGATPSAPNAGPGAR